MGTPDAARAQFLGEDGAFRLTRPHGDHSRVIIQPNLNGPELQNSVRGKGFFGEAAISTSAAVLVEIGCDVGHDLPFTDPRLEQAYLYWRAKAAGRALPSRADIDPVEIPKLLPDVMLVERHDNGRYRYRLIGTENARAHGINATGRFLDEVLPGPDYAAHVLALYDECVEARCALYSECLFFSPGRHEPERHTKVLFLPLSADGETINMIFVVQVFLYIDRATRERHFVDARPYKEITHILL